MFQQPNPTIEWPIDYDAVMEIAKSEGLELKAYLCEAGVWTIGYGHIKGVRKGMTCTYEQANQWLFEDIAECAHAINFHLLRPANPNQLGAMVSLAFNIGVNAFLTSTVMREHNIGNTLSAARAFGLWNKITDPRTKKKVESRGLTLRRARESALYLEYMDDAIEHVDGGPYGVPQRVVGESLMRHSPIAQSGVASIAGGVVATVSGFVAPIREFAYSLGINPLVVLGGLAVVVGAIVIVQRLRQRREGWA